MHNADLCNVDTHTLLMYLLDNANITDQHTYNTIESKIEILCASFEEDFVTLGSDLSVRKLQEMQNLEEEVIGLRSSLEEQEAINNDLHFDLRENKETIERLKKQNEDTSTRNQKLTTINDNLAIQLQSLESVVNIIRQSVEIFDLNYIPVPKQMYNKV